MKEQDELCRETTLNLRGFWCPKLLFTRLPSPSLHPCALLPLQEPAHKSSQKPRLLISPQALKSELREGAPCLLAPAEGRVISWGLEGDVEEGERGKKGKKTEKTVRQKDTLTSCLSSRASELHSLVLHQLWCEYSWSCLPSNLPRSLSWVTRHFIFASLELWR